MTEFIKYLSLKKDESGDNLYFISDETTKRELHRYNLNNEELIQVTNEKENVKNFWHVDEGLLIATDYNGNEREQLTYIKNGSVQKITDDGDYYHHYGVYMKDHFIFLRNHHDGKDFDLVKYSQGQLEVMATFERPTSIVSKFDDEKIILSQQVNNIDKEIYLFNIHTGSIKKHHYRLGVFQTTVL